MIRNKIVRTLLKGLIALSLLAAIAGMHHVWKLPALVSFVLFPAIIIYLYYRTPAKLFIGVVIGLFLLMLIIVGTLKPRNDLNWLVAHSILPKLTLSNNNITIQNYRNFEWRNTSEAKQTIWEHRSYDLSKLNQLDLVVEPFKDSDFLAHVMLRFHFQDQGTVIVSVEARQEKGESYGLIPGSFRQFEIIYIFGSERDLMDLRAYHRGTRLYAFPVKAERQFIVDLFKDLATAADQLRTEPQFYRSIRDNCTTTLVKHVDRHYERPIGLRYETIFPALTGKLLYDWDYMDTELTYKEAKEQFRVDHLIRQKYANRSQ